MTEKKQITRYGFSDLMIGSFIVHECRKKDSKKVAKRLRSAAQMYKMRRRKNIKVDITHEELSIIKGLSFRVTEVIGAVILERIR